MSKPQRYLSLDRGVWRSVAEKTYTGLVFVVARGPAIRGAVGGDRSTFGVADATPAVRKRRLAPPASVAATFKAAHPRRDFREMQATPAASSAASTAGEKPTPSREIRGGGTLCEQEKRKSSNIPTLARKSLQIG